MVRDLNGRRYDGARALPKARVLIVGVGLYRAKSGPSVAAKLGVAGDTGRNGANPQSCNRVASAGDL